MTPEKLRQALQGIQNGLDALQSDSLAYAYIQERATDAHNYVSKHATQGAWGRNIWHVILDDAIALRTEIQKMKENK